MELITNTTNPITFTFNPNTDQVHGDFVTIRIEPDVCVYIKCLTRSVASLTIHDMNGCSILHQGLAIYTTNPWTQKRTEVCPIEPKPVIYVLCYTESYEIEWNGEVKITISPNRTWCIRNKCKE
jgi:hypothetical protein